MKQAASFACLAFVYVALTSVSATAGCLLGSRVVPRDNQTVTGVIHVRAGSSCGIHHGASLGPMLSTEIVRRPGHGTALVVGRHQVVYMAPRSYVGRDEFVYARRGQDMRGNPVVRVVRVRVGVYPPLPRVTTGSRR